jgi:type IV pilus assembly protein PilA
MKARVISQESSMSVIRSAQQGLSLIEVSIVTAIVLLLAIIGVPAIGAYVVENKVPKVGEEIARFILQTKVNASNVSDTPYQGIDTVNFANLVRDSSIFAVSGDGSTLKVLHGLGNEGVVSVAAEESGASFSITLSKVHNAACPSIASILQRVSDSMTVASDGQGSTVIKNDTVLYSALAAEARCAKGDVNTFVFTAS